MADGSGCSAWIHLGLVEKAEADPQFLAFKETLQCVRLCQNESQLGMLIDLAIQQNFVFPAGMPTQALVFRLQYVGWTMQNGVNIRDSWGVFFHDMNVSFPELILRAEANWLYVVAAKVSSRPCF